MTFPRMRAMSARWREVPPAALQLARIASALGLKPQAVRPESASDFMSKAQGMGVPVMQGRPDDPMLAFLDIPRSTVPPNTPRHATGDQS